MSILLTLRIPQKLYKNQTRVVRRVERGVKDISFFQDCLQAYFLLFILEVLYNGRRTENSGYLFDFMVLFFLIKKV